MTKYNFSLSAGALIFIIISNFNSGTAAVFDGTELYRVSPVSASYDDVQISLVKLRQKRQTQPIYAKNQYESVSQNANGTASDAHKTAETATTSNISSIVVPYNVADKPLLGVNGTGQRKDSGSQLSQPKTTIVSDPIQSTLGAAAGFVQETSSNDQSTETTEEKLIDNVDVPDNETVSEIEKNSYTVNVTNDHHIYYNSSIYVDKAEADRVWEQIKNTSFNSMLSQSHRRAMV
ncbi:uncharacterized protein LOC118734734 [Rhagoletis pomonella]|uniref:uncharacterized protein LOC118734734 n=1 Tax=Rhagoletis pomonella TaxID=28610 RepID=UPI00177F5B59|nr:uncharacterized protein LOC118734734 [Rhagoletis pomonella]